MSMVFPVPQIDPQNPLYCPDVPASAYLLSLHRQLRPAPPNRPPFPWADDEVLAPFEKSLDHTLSEDFSSSLGGYPHFPPGLKYKRHSPRRPLARNRTEACWPKLNTRPSSPINRERNWDCDGFPVHEKSLLGDRDHDSFDLGCGAEEGLEYAGRQESGSGNWEAQDESLRGFTVTDSPRGINTFIGRLDAIFPDMRLAERLRALAPLTLHTIVDVLLTNGLINARVLDLLRSSDITCLCLAPSVVDQDGFNLAGQDLLRVFSKPDSFLSLSEIILNGVPLQDFSLVHIHHLPQLSTLLLDDTGISNEAIYLLTSLKHTLSLLSVNFNPLINDEAMPALLILSNLSFLSILDTGIGMPGLRRLAWTIQEEGRVVDVQIPLACEQYIDNMHMEYEMDLAPPLVADPSVVETLSLAALKRNLATHAARNGTISTGGTQSEMEGRLKELLRRRRDDLIVREVISGEREVDEVTNGEMDSGS